jgi:hypothetical protein
MLQLIDPSSGAPNFAEGNLGGFTLAPPDEGGVITPSDSVVYDPPVMVWVGDVGPVNVAVVPYGREGDKTVTYPLKLGMSVPVVCKQILTTGTTATSLFLGSAYPSLAMGGGGGSGPVTADSTTVTADTTSFTADSG